MRRRILSVIFAAGIVLWTALIFELNLSATRPSVKRQVRPTSILQSQRIEDFPR
jgi:hypothetical protein